MELCPANPKRTACVRTTRGLCGWVHATGRRDDRRHGNPVGASALADLRALVDHSLLRRREMAHGEARLGMLQTIRAFALERLQASGEESAIRAAHADLFMALAEEAAPTLRFDADIAALDRVEAEHDNLRAALRWCLDNRDAARAVRITAALTLLAASRPPERRPRSGSTRRSHWTRRPRHRDPGRGRCGGPASLPTTRTTTTWQLSDSARAWGWRGPWATVKPRPMRCPGLPQPLVATRRSRDATRRAAPVASASKVNWNSYPQVRSLRTRSYVTHVSPLPHSVHCLH